MDKLVVNGGMVSTDCARELTEANLAPTRYHKWNRHMESSKTLNWLQFGGVVGILVGLVLVGIQISQASELTRLQIENEWLVNGWHQKGLVMMGESPAEIVAKALDQPDSLTTDEMLILEIYLRWSELQWNDLLLWKSRGSGVVGCSRRRGWLEIGPRVL